MFSQMRQMGTEKRDVTGWLILTKPLSFKVSSHKQRKNGK